MSKKYGFIFISRSQCASTTIRRVLDPYSEIQSTDGNLSSIDIWFNVAENYMRKTLGYEEKIKCAPHIPARRLKKTLELLGIEWDDFYSFTSVRNPWKRMVSRYEYGLKNENSTYHEPAVKVDNFDEFLYEISDSINSTRFEKNAFDENGQYLFDDVIKVEKIEKGIKRIGKKIGIVNLNVPHKNKNIRSRKLSEYYSKKSKMYVYDKYKFEIEKFGYEFPEEYNV